MENTAHVKPRSRDRSATRMLCEGAIMVALAQILSYIKLMELPNGGSLTPAMFPVLLFALRWGVKDGLLAGFVFGLLQLIFDGAYAWGWQSMLLDYLLAFTPLGLAGLFKGNRIAAPTEVLGTVFDNPELYSLVYNGSYMLPNTVLALAIAALLYVPMKKYYAGSDLIR